MLTILTIGQFDQDCFFFQYYKTRHSYIYMLPIADQTDGPIGLNFCVDTQGWLGGVF